MSKKVSEFDRYERMKKMEKEAEAQKRKASGSERKKAGHPKRHMEMDFQDYDNDEIYDF